MSRTFKDKPFKYLTKNTAKCKRSFIPNYFFYYRNNPSWWSRVTTTKRRRRENRVYETTIKLVSLEELDLYEPHLNWNKPKQYYW